ncbi:MAG: amidohydrolase [Eggerthellaceae bacterium]|jgi:5-methylthioadenosine/S-adenosylhomocysteine deaminase|nr:amidohydrolase [Eggerthellaceae bacterium]MCH4221025.1 amidohydrolase [Eggerthellaceae bacterium]
MLFADIDILDEQMNYVPHCWVGVRDGRIDYIGDTAPADASAYGESYDGSGRLLMSGFFNAHAHAPMTLLRGWGEALPLDRWLNERIFPFEAQLTADDIYWGTLLTCAEMLRYGTVSFSDMYYSADARFRACKDAGIKINLGETLVAPDEKPYSEYPLCALNQRLLKEYHGSCDGRLLLDFNIHAEYTTNPTTVQGIAQAAADEGVRMQVHVSETKAEVEQCRERHQGMSPVVYLNSLGVFDVPTTAAHCVWVDQDDIAILRDKKVFVAHNPVSNMKLGSGFAPVKNMIDQGICVSLGTDGTASNNNLDMMQDMYVMALLHKGTSLDPTVLTPQQILTIATRNGALSQGRDDTGVLKVGAKADLCVLDTTGASWTPMTNPVANVVYAGHGDDVCLTMVDGIVRYRDGSWPSIDIDQAKAHVVAAAQRIIATL